MFSRLVGPVQVGFRYVLRANRMERAGGTASLAAVLSAQNGWYVFDAQIAYSRSYPKSARLGRSLFGTPHSRQVQHRRLAAFAREFAQRIGL